MANSKLNQLTEATDLVNTDLFLLEQNSTAKKLTWRSFLEKTLAALSGQSGILKVSGRNLLDNPFFTVNQRGATAYTVGAYGADRWKLISGSATVTENGITLNGTLRQILEQKPEGEVTASVKMYSGAGSAAYDSTNGYFDITSSGGTVRAAKLEAGSVSTLENDEAPNYAEELAKCQRYYLAMNALGGGTIMGVGPATNASTLRILVPTPVPMRIQKPAVECPEYADFTAYGNGTRTAKVSKFEAVNTSQFGMTINCTMDSAVVKDQVYVVLNGSKKYFALNADL